MTHKQQYFWSIITVILLSLGVVASFHAQVTEDLLSADHIIQAIGTPGTKQCVMIPIGDDLPIVTQPHTAHRQVAWSEDDGNDYEIMVWQDGIITQLTDNDYYDVIYDMSDDYIAWTGDDDVFVWDGNQTTQLTHPDYYDMYPKLSGDHLVWQTLSMTGGDWGLIYWHGSDMLPIPTYGLDISISSVSIYQEKIAWVGTDEDTSIFYIYLWDGTQNIPITSFSGDTSYSIPIKIHNNRIVWRNGSSILLWDNGTISTITSSLVKPWIRPYLYGNGVAWIDNDGNDDEVYFWDGSQITPLTSNDYNDSLLIISGGSLSWYAETPDDSTIYIWDGQEITALHIPEPLYYMNTADNNLVWTDYVPFPPPYPWLLPLTYADCSIDFDTFDMNGDDLISPVDVMFVIDRFGLDPTGDNAPADVNGDGVINADDAQEITNNLRGHH